MVMDSCFLRQGRRGASEAVSTTNRGSLSSRMQVLVNGLKVGLDCMLLLRGQTSAYALLSPGLLSQ
jgi:hypothetical protein